MTSVSSQEAKVASPIRDYAYRSQVEAIVNCVPEMSTVLDTSCGDGLLAVLLAQKECVVTAMDVSPANIEAAKALAAASGVADRITFVAGDPQRLPFPDKEFEYVVSNHVLEHLPDFAAGVKELNRVARNYAVVAIPTCLSPTAMVLLGGDTYWATSRRSWFALFIGLGRVLRAMLKGHEGVTEGYAGKDEFTNLWRFPRVGLLQLAQSGLLVSHYRASSYTLPYFVFLLPVARFFETLVWVPGFRNFGYGTTYLCVPASQDRR